MIEPASRSRVWRSTEPSRAAGLVSVLAVAETLACVVVYWLLWLWLGVTWHHWLILIATPLVLLRSDASIAKGVEWFEAYFNTKFEAKLTSPKSLGILGVSAVIAGCVAWSLATYWTGDDSGWALFGKAALIGCLSLNIVMVFATKIAGAVLRESMGSAAIVVVAVVAAFVLSFPGFIFGFWLRATATRFAATARYLWPGLRQLPVNWRFSMLVSDVWQPPELIPGIPRFAYGGAFTFSRRNGDGLRKPFFEWLLDATVATFFFLPAMLWRWSIKSTAWFYIPLLWVRRGWLSLQGEDLRIWAQSYSRKALNWLWLLFGGLSFVALGASLFSLEKWLAMKQATDDANAPMTFIGVLSSLNWADLLTQPWMWFYIPSYALTIYLFFALDSIAAEIRAGATPDSRLPQIARLKWAANARAVVTNIGLALALWYFLAAVGAWQQLRAFLALLL